MRTMKLHRIGILIIAILFFCTSHTQMVNYNENENLFFHVSANDYDSDGVLNSNDLCPNTNDTDWSNVDEGGCVQHEIEQATFYRQTTIDNLPDSWNGEGSGFLNSSDANNDVAKWSFVLPQGTEGAHISAWETHDEGNDFDLYVYKNLTDNPENYPDFPIEISETYDEPTESISFRADDVGEYTIVISAFDGIGTFDAGIDIIENNAPHTIIEASDQSVYIYERVNFDACGTSDLDDNFDDLNFSWSINYPGDESETLLSIYECDFELPVNLAGIHNISVTATDPWGAFTEIIYSLEVLSLPADGTNISDEFIGEWIYDLSNQQPFTIGGNLNHRFLDIPFTDQDLYWATGMQYHITIHQEGELILNQTITEQNNLWKIAIDTLSINASYEVTFKPEIVIDYYRWGENSENEEEWIHGELFLPVPSQSEMYEGEPSVNVGSHTVYYWDDHVTLDVLTENGTTGFSIDETIDLSEIDLYPLVQSILEKTPVSGALQFIELFGDFSMPLTMGVDLNVDGIFGMSWIQVTNGTGTLHNSTNGTGDISYDDVIILDEGNFFPTLDLHHPSIVSYLNASENGTNVSIYPFFSSFAYGEVSGYIDIGFRVSAILYGEILNETWRVLEVSEPDYEETFVNIPYEIAFNWASPIDSDGDGIRDDYDDCPFENASSNDADLDGCLDVESKSSSSFVSVIGKILLWLVIIVLITGAIAGVVIFSMKRKGTATTTWDDDKYETTEKEEVAVVSNEQNPNDNWGVNISQISNPANEPVEVQQIPVTQNAVSPEMPPTTVKQWTDENGYTWRTMSNGKMQWWNGTDWIDR